jgi:hypothetical protein
MGSDFSRQHRRQLFQQLVEYLRERMRSPDQADEVIVRRHELEEFARSIGMDEEEAWRRFGALKGHSWQGKWMEESRSEERGYTAARLWRVN